MNAMFPDSTRTAPSLGLEAQTRREFLMNDPDESPIPTFYSIASSGSTALTRLLISRYLVTVANEVHPYSFRPLFNPTHPVATAINQLSLSVEEMDEIWKMQILLFRRLAESRGNTPLLRIHSHSDYAGEFTPNFRKMPHSATVLRKMVGPEIVVVRHPVLNFYSSKTRGFFLGNLHDWLMVLKNFLSDYEGVQVWQVEKLLGGPNDSLAEVAGILGLEAREAPLQEREIPIVSGDTRDAKLRQGDEFLGLEQDKLNHLFSNATTRTEIRENRSAIEEALVASGYLNVSSLDMT